MELEVREKILRILEEAGRSGLSQGELVIEAGYSKSWVSEVLRELEKKGLIARVPGPGKTKRVVLSKYLDPSIGRTIRVGLVRASEYIYLPNFIKYLKTYGYEVEIVLFENVSEATSALARADVHVSITPLYTQAVYRALGASIKTYSGGALRGASLIYRNFGGKTLSSRASTMEIAAIAIHRALHYGDPEILYYDEPESGIKAFIRGSADAIAIWEPYASELEKMGFRRVRLAEYVGSYYCCTLARHENLNYEVSQKIGDAWERALKDVRSGVITQNPLQAIGIENLPMEKTLKEYEYTEELIWDYIKKVLSYVSGFLLNLTTIRELLKN
ncbi:MAG: MarR family transcriptional regulator [Sulfolobales archaeon]|nr:MarR family transcriptional regulator [Sulfolobales archaeon]MDW8082467.1 MarR family transcriptional regulator [Sulfolobales archaeon]